MRKKRYCYAYQAEKVHFKTEAEARAFIQEHQLSQQPYKCTSCLGWHLTSQNSRNTAPNTKPTKRTHSNEPETRIDNDTFFNSLLKLRERL